jgi:hypothetical protein
MLRDLRLNAKTLKVKIGGAECMKCKTSTRREELIQNDVLDSIHNFNKNFIHYSVQMEQNSIPKYYKWKRGNRIRHTKLKLII